MTETTSQARINAAVWKACDTFRGVIDPSDYKNYVLIMLFLKYISDVAKDRLEELKARYGDNEAMIDRQMSRSRFILPERCSFDYLFARRSAPNIGELIDRALEEIEDENSAKLHDVFRNVSFDSPTLGEKKDANNRLKHLLEDFSGLDLRPSCVSGDIIGKAYMFLIENFASSAGKIGGEFYTPTGVSRLLARLLQPQPGDRICDPACGSGSLLIEVGNTVPEHERHNYSLYGQESNGSTWALCRLNMLLHNEDSADIRWGNTLTNPLLLEHDQLMRFNVVVANPPFSLDKWGAERAADDPFKRFWRGVPPKSKGDYAFITHMVETALPREGRVGVITPHGVLFRGGAEGKIRQSLIEDNLLDAVIGLPVNLFYGTGIPAAILIFDRSREEGGVHRDRADVLFIDASREFLSGKSQNYLRPEDVDRIAETYQERREEPRYSRRVPLSEIIENDFNLNIARYIDTTEEAEEIDLGALQREIEGLEAELAEVRANLNPHLRDLEVI